MSLSIMGAYNQVDVRPSRKSRKEVAECVRRYATLRQVPIFAPLLRRSICHLHRYALMRE